MQTMMVIINALLPLGWNVGTDFLDVHVASIWNAINWYGVDYEKCNTKHSLEIWEASLKEGSHRARRIHSVISNYYISYEILL